LLCFIAVFPFGNTAIARDFRRNEMKAINVLHWYSTGSKIHSFDVDDIVHRGSIFGYREWADEVMGIALDWVIYIIWEHVYQHTHIMKDDKLCVRIKKTGGAHNFKYKLPAYVNRSMSVKIVKRINCPDL